LCADPAVGRIGSLQQLVQKKYQRRPRHFE
jgi:hypothetical protein